MITKVLLWLIDVHNADFLFIFFSFVSHSSVTAALLYNMWEYDSRQASGLLTAIF